MTLIAEHIIQILEKLDDLERLDIFYSIVSKYCLDCGRPQPASGFCPCCNDE